ncbi:MAG: hypothetical protein IT385_14850 [Deltaproteobacteria bacterium]|nr:hypothetical protein [Deltaproteobacteria bacterium]
MPEPKPLTQCTPAPRAQQPTSKPAANPTSRGAVGVKQKVRAAPTMAEQEAALAPQTIAMGGQPVMALGQVQAATAAARSEQRIGPQFGDRIRQASATQGESARIVGDYLPDLIDHGGRAHYPRYIAEAKADHTAYRSAEASTALVVPAWTAAHAVASEADVRWDGALRALDFAGLADRARGRVDNESLASEGRAYASGVGRMVSAPRVDGGEIQTAMRGLLAAGATTNMAVTALRAQLLEQRADAAQAEIDERGQVLGDIVNLGGSVVGLASSPGVGSAVTFATTVVDMLRGPTGIEARVLGFRATAKSERERGAWQAIDQAVKAFDVARSQMDDAMQRLHDDTDATKVDLANKGADADDRDPRLKPVAATKRPAQERLGAIGLHLGSLLEAQRFTAAARDGWASVRPALDHAAMMADQATHGQRVPEVLAEAKDRMAPPATFLTGIQGFHAQVEARYAERLARIGPGVKAVVSQLSTLTAGPQDAKR